MSTFRYVMLHEPQLTSLPNVRRARPQSCNDPICGCVSPTLDFYSHLSCPAAGSHKYAAVVCPWSQGDKKLHIRYFRIEPLLMLSPRAACVLRTCKTGRYRKNPKVLVTELRGLISYHDPQTPSAFIQCRFPVCSYPGYTGYALFFVSAAVGSTPVC